MKFSKPLVLLLGSVLSASSVGCSAITAVVYDSRPSFRESQGNSDRLVAIARVFENQGRYDKAEVMYRKAQRVNPNDPAIGRQLQLLAECRSEKQFGPSSTTNAIAMADAVRPQKQVKQARRSASPEVKPASESAPLNDASKTLAANQEAAKRNRNSGKAVLDAKTTSISNAVLNSDAASRIDLVSGTKVESNGSIAAQVTTEDVMGALECPDQHVHLLLRALEQGADPETRSLAATLLGDCDPANVKVRDALKDQHQPSSPAALMLAVCDSQIERGEATQMTADCLTKLCRESGTEIQIQSAALLRNFAGTEFDSLCVQTLGELLSSNTPTVRATAAATLGDFNNIGSEHLQRLQELAGPDSNQNVREAANSALARHQTSVPEIIPLFEMSIE